MIDWTPIIVAIAGAITLLATSVATWIQTRANAGKINETHSLVNGGLGDIRARIAALERRTIAPPSDQPPPPAEPTP